MAQITFKDDQCGFFLWILPDELASTWQQQMEKGFLSPKLQEAYLQYMEGEFRQLMLCLKGATRWPDFAVPMGKIIDAHLKNLQQDLLKYLADEKKRLANQPPTPPQ